jgi:predicted homoserine dehydrogenase-like protein
VILVENALKRPHKAADAVRVPMAGARLMAWSIALQINLSVPGMSLVAISNRVLTVHDRPMKKREIKAFEKWVPVQQLEDAIMRGRPAVTEGPGLLYQATGIDTQRILCVDVMRRGGEIREA